MTNCVHRHDIKNTHLFLVAGDQAKQVLNLLNENKINFEIVAPKVNGGGDMLEPLLE